MEQKKPARPCILTTGRQRAIRSIAKPASCHHGKPRSRILIIISGNLLINYLTLVKHLQHFMGYDNFF